MWPILAKLFGGGISTVVDSAGGLVKTIWGDRAAKDAADAARVLAKDAAIASEQHDVLGQFASEFVARQQRTWWDSFADGLNRLPRPMLVIGVHASFIWAAWDPVNFTICMQALQVVPDALCVVWLTIVAFYFGGRTLEKLPATWKVEPRQLDLARQIIADRAALRPTEAAARLPTPPPPPPLYGGPVQQTEADHPPGLDAAVPPEAWAEPAIPPDEVQVSPAVDNSCDPERAVAATIWGEARGEPFEGKLAVVCVIRNRVENPGWWGRDWISVCTAKWQFSCWFDGQAQDVRTVGEGDAKFRECLAGARAVIDGMQNDPTAGATHYFADTIATPKWARGKTPTTKIGHHVFYKLGLGG